MIYLKLFPLLVLEVVLTFLFISFLLTLAGCQIILSTVVWLFKAPDRILDKLNAITNKD